tara:strand:- start:50 stop:160 length:111 start_codon:yes stop_codon:yes gene_type:complete
MNLKFLNKNTTRWNLQAGFNVAVIVVLVILLCEVLV